jgi:hypothetical protein
MEGDLYEELQLGYAVWAAGHAASASGAGFSALLGGILGMLGGAAWGLRRGRGQSKYPNLVSG